MNKNVQTVYTFHLGDTLIDTAQRHSKSEVIRNLDGQGIGKIVLTHFHEDHSGNAAYLKRRWKVPVYAHPEAVKILRKGYNMSPLGYLLNGQVARFTALPLLETDVIDTGKYTLQPIYTPGHSHDHYSYYAKEKGWLFSGDLFVAERIKYFANFESMRQQIDSIRLLCSLDFDVLLCSHNPKIRNGKGHLHKKLQDLEDFYGTVVRLNKKGMTLGEILQHTGRKENVLYNIVTLGGFNAINMVKSVLRDEGVLK